MIIATYVLPNASPALALGSVGSVAGITVDPAPLGDPQPEGGVEEEEEEEEEGVQEVQLYGQDKRHLDGCLHTEHCTGLEQQRASW